MPDLSRAEAESLAISDLYCEYKVQKGQSGRAPVVNFKKSGLAQVKYKSRSVQLAVETAKAKAAFQWLTDNQPVTRCQWRCVFTFCFVGQFRDALAVYHKCTTFGCGSTTSAWRRRRRILVSQVTFERQSCFCILLGSKLRLGQ